MIFLFRNYIIIQPKGENKWESTLDTQFDESWWKTCNFYTVKSVKDTTLIWFQNRIVHRILSTNTYLCKIGLKQNNPCDFCHEFPNTIQHIFWECSFVSLFGQIYQNG